MKYTVVCGELLLDTQVKLLITESFQEAVDACCDHCKVIDEEGDVVHVGMVEDEEEDWDEPDEDEVGLGEVSEQQENQDFAQDDCFYPGSDE